MTPKKKVFVKIPQQGKVIVKDKNAKPKEKKEKKPDGKKTESPEKKTKTKKKG